MRPENSLEAFAYAISAGADAIELDLRVTSDDVLVVSHDPILSQPAQVICDTTLSQLNGRIPALEDVLEFVLPARIELNLEIKSDPHAPEQNPDPGRFAALVVRLICKYGLQARSMIQSFDFRVLRAVRLASPNLRRGALFEGDTRDYRAIAEEAGGVHYVAPEFRLITPGKVRQAHEAGMRVIPWTVNRSRDWQSMAAAGVDGIITDDPAALVSWLESRGLR